MTNDELDTIEARAKAATPGPWWVARGSEGAVIADVASYEVVTRSDRGDALAAATFIAVAREAVPALVAEARRLNGVIEESARLHEIGAERMAKQVDRVRELEDLCRDFAENYDCDSDAHRHGYADSQCRCCKARAALEGRPAP